MKSSCHAVASLTIEAARCFNAWTYFAHTYITSELVLVELINTGMNLMNSLDSVRNGHDSEIYGR